MSCIKVTKNHKIHVHCLTQYLKKTCYFVKLTQYILNVSLKVMSYSSQIPHYT